VVTSTPRISIIIPTLQEEGLIARTLAQFTDELKSAFQLEVIVSDGGSVDHTVEIACGRADRVVEWKETHKQNIAIGRNRGAHIARGDIFMFFNADVLIEQPDLFFPMMIEAVSRDVVAAATCNVLIYRHDERLVDRLFHSFFNWYFWQLNVLGMGMGRGECHVMRREIFEKMGGYDEALAAGEDYELYRRLHHIGKIAFIRTLNVFESPRRYRKFGYLWITFLWFLNGISVLLFNRSFVREWKPVR
jgi:glycosyltransferase involved in cell wall biosynthesis